MHICCVDSNKIFKLPLTNPNYAIMMLKLNFLQTLHKHSYTKNDRSFLHNEGLNNIRDEIINVVFLASGIFGVFSLYGSILRILQYGFHPIIIYHVVLFVSIWGVVIFRQKIHPHWKSGVFFVLFFLSGTFLNLENGVISGALHFILVSTIITLLYGWRLGALSIALTFVTRTTIAVLFAKGVLVNEYDLNKYAISTPILLSTILGALFAASVVVFAINMFYRWLLQTLESVKDKVVELEYINNELEIANAKAVENDRLKTVFLTNMSHEVRTPMNAIVGFSNLLGKPGLIDSKRKKYSTLVQERSYDLLRLIEDILDISKIEIGQFKIAESEANLNKILTEIYDYYQLKKGRGEIAVDVNIELKVDESVNGKIILTDIQRLKQILTNLIENALKFTNEGIIEIGCNVTDKINFYIKDAGIGIPEDKQTLIFDRFRQADESISARQYGGTGLGLSICKGILELMGGNIGVKSEVGKGSTFYFSLPLKESGNQEVPDKSLVDKQMDFNGKSILVIEDDHASAEFIRELLSGSNINIIHSYTAAETLQVLEKNTSVDLLLMDIRLPDMNGIDLTNKIRKEFSKIKIIAQTAYASTEDIQECLNAGCNDYISKPIKGDDLLSLLEKHMNN